MPARSVRRRSGLDIRMVATSYANTESCRFRRFDLVSGRRNERQLAPCARIIGTRANPRLPVGDIRCLRLSELNPAVLPVPSSVQPPLQLQRQRQLPG